MTTNFISKIENLYHQFKQHDDEKSDRLERYRNIEPESAELLSILVRAQQSKNILEIGTSTGYSTLWLANAAKSTQGRVITLEVDKDRMELAQQHARDFLLDDVIDFNVIDALEYLRNTTTQFDLILLDAERDAYCEYWTYISKLLKEKGGLLVVDNVISHQHEVKDFIEMVCLDSRFATTILPIGAGLFLVTSL